MQNETTLFHTGFLIIREPDIHIGRKNADFGQGFYLSDNEEFSRRWARERENTKVYLNRYRINYDGLKVKVFARDKDWYEYIYRNRHAYPDLYADYDVITGPIANDTIYDTWGIITSGLLSAEQSLELLQLGPSYTQTVLKSERAVQALQFEAAQEMPKKEIEGCKSLVEEEEKHYQEAFAQLLEKLV